MPIVLGVIILVSLSLVLLQLMRPHRAGKEAGSIPQGPLLNSRLLKSILIALTLAALLIAAIGLSIN